MNTKNEENTLHETKHGGKYFEALPEGCRIASIDDFYDKYSKLIIDKPYLVHSMLNPKRYWANRVRKGFPYPWTDFKVFLESGNVFVFEGE